MVPSCGTKRTSHCALHLHSARSTWTTPTLTLLYITRMASPVCKALQVLQHGIYGHILRTDLLICHINGHSMGGQPIPFCEGNGNAEQKERHLPHGWKSVPCPAPVTQSDVLDLNSLKNRARGANKTRPSEETKPGSAFCASLRNRKCTWTTHMETVVRAGADEMSNPDGTPWSNPGL